MDDEIVVVSLKTDKDTFLMTDDEDQIQGFSSLSKGLDYFESSYHRHFSLNHTGPATVMIHDMEFNPKVHITTMQELKTLVEIPFKILKIRSDTGGYNVIPMTVGDIDGFREKGHSPKWG